MGKTIFSIFLVFILLVSAGQAFLPEDDKPPIDVFLKKNGVWSGEFANFVNQEGGRIQEGKIRMKMAIDSNGVISQSIAFIRPDGKMTDYQGSATMKVEGNRLNWIGSVTVDESTGNPIENHVFEGYVGWNQIYFVETYEEVFPEGRREKRRNSGHYIITEEGKLLWLADAHVDGKLLVFANTVLELQEK